MTFEVISCTLPIEIEADRLSLDQNKAKEFGEELAGSYCFAKPYPHIVIDNFLPEELLNRVLSDFPEVEGSSDTYYLGGYAGHFKRAISPYSSKAFIRCLFEFFNTAPFLQFLEGLTRIGGIIPDPYYAGGGLHEISRGGMLGVHADFRILERLNLNRRLNVLIYLNKDWNSQYGGDLEIWDSGMQNKVRSISPIFNRCVIFNTDASSYHGHPDPLNTPDGVRRKSIALYYYTASSRIYEELPSHSTMYAARPGDGNKIKNTALRLNFSNYKKDLVPPALLHIRLWIPPFLFRRLKAMFVKKNTE